MQNEINEKVNFAINPGLILDRILTIFAHKGRDVAMQSLVDAVRADVQAQAHGGYTPRTLLWYVVGARISGDASFYVQPDFVAALGLSEREKPLYQVNITGIEMFRSATGESA